MTKRRRTAGAAACAVAAVLFGLVSQPAGAASGAPSTFSARTPGVVNAGGDAALTLNYRIAAAGTFLLDAEIKDAGGTTVQQWYKTETFAVPTTRTVTLTWHTGSAKPGRYAVAQGIYTPDWANLAWAASSAQMTVAASAASPVSTAAQNPAAARRLFGAYVFGSPGMSAFRSEKSSLGHNLDLAEWFADWTTPFDASSAQQAVANGASPVITWEPWNVDLKAIASGDNDSYIKAWASQAKAFGKTLYVRPFPEMNGSWSSWNGNAPALVAAWRHVVDQFRNAGATNVKWVWSPNENDDPATAANRMEAYYPGASYVDILAFDGYNWGSNGPNGWRTFDQIVKPIYQRLTAIGTQPIWVTETASSPVGGNKAQWITDMFTTAAKYPRLQGIIWFDENKEQDWRLAADPANAAAANKSLSTWAR